MRKFRVAGLWVLAMLMAMPASAKDNAAAGAWQVLAKGDADAALALIAGNHPGASAELGDTDFQARLAAARAHVDERLPGVKDYAGYAALMSGLATDFRDGHIWSTGLVAPIVRNWAGLVIVRQGGQWMVGAQDAAEGEPALTGARLADCDGVPAERWAAERLGQFQANPAVEAQLARRGPVLLLDDGNPFLVRPTACGFVTADGKAERLTLRWRRIGQPQIERLAGSVMHPARAGMGVAPFAGGYWISLGTLGDAAQKVVDAVTAQQAALRAAPMVVLDLRGNGGGNSAYADRIAAALVGDARASALDEGGSDCQGAFWRASPGNLDTLRGLAARSRAQGDAEGEREWGGLADDMTAAIASGRGFAPALPVCARTAKVAAHKAGKLPPSAMRGRLVLVTDRACFSSCLIAADKFRALGALHVGEATDVSTRYMEVREIVLPSGLRTFSTLQKVAVGLGDFGPYAPERAYPGALDDEEKLKAWVAGLH